MDYCGPRGIPHSEFLSWDEDDQQKALWWSAQQGQKCQQCGTHPDDWDPEKGGSGHAFHADVRLCPGCRAIAVRQAQLDKERDSGAPVHGQHVVLIRTVEGGEDARHEG